MYLHQARCCLCAVHTVFLAAVVAAPTSQPYEENADAPCEKQGRCEFTEPLNSEGVKRAGVMTQKLNTKTALSQDPKVPPKTNTTAGMSLVCGEHSKVTSASHQDNVCPTSCPFFVEDISVSFCTFACIQAETCKRIDPEAPLADKQKGVCRKPWIRGCKEYDMSELHQDRCSKCSTYYDLLENGSCRFTYMWVLFSLGGFLLFIAIVLALWILNLFCRPSTNEPGLLQGLRVRSNAKLQRAMPIAIASESPQSDLPSVESLAWPLMTNLTSVDVGGAGMCLHFNFQIALIAWAVLVAVGYLIFSYIVDLDLLTLGTKRIGTSRENCILVAWGWEKQHDLMDEKTWFLAIVYVVSFGLCILYSIYQMRVFEDLDSKLKTPKDFTLQLTDLPMLNGAERVEEKLKSVLLDACSKKSPEIELNIEGISVCWDYGSKEEDVIKAVIATLHPTHRADFDMIREESMPESVAAAESTASMGFVSRWCLSFEKKWLVGEVEEDEAQDADGIISILEDLNTSDCAYVVFSTEAERDKAVELLNSGHIIFEGHKIGCKAMDVEPFTVNWGNFHRDGARAKSWRLLRGVFEILMALLLWAICFYGPYAWAVCSFNYANGHEPPLGYNLVFSTVVVIGNVMMYTVAAKLSDEMKFRSKDVHQACYMIIYLIACMTQVLFDFWTTYFQASHVADGLDFRTYDGDRLKNVASFTERFETYAMQRILAENVFTYAFPSTYLIPFLLEPFSTIYVPLLLGKAIVRSHPELVGRRAEKWLAATPMNMGRYADLLLNLVLAILIFFLPGGYTPVLFGLMAACHIFIYIFDHYRVLRTIPLYKLSSAYVDRCSQFLLVPCVGLILGALLYKIKAKKCVGNTGNTYCYGWFRDVMPLNIVLVLLHCAVHASLLMFVVPMFRKRHKDELSEIQYKDVAKLNGMSYFSLNPVHCLRSEYMYLHCPPCKHLIPGKDHLLELNHKIGCYYKRQLAPHHLDDDHGHWRSRRSENG